MFGCLHHGQLFFTYGPRDGGWEDQQVEEEEC
jgi:hypothetical protein